MDPMPVLFIHVHQRRFYARVSSTYRCWFGWSALSDVMLLQWLPLFQDTRCAFVVDFFM